MIKKTKEGYEVTSEEGKALSKKDLSKGGAKKRLEQVEYFKHKGKDKEEEEEDDEDEKEEKEDKAKKKSKKPKEKTEDEDLQDYMSNHAKRKGFEK